MGISLLGSSCRTFVSCHTPRRHSGNLSLHGNWGHMERSNDVSQRCPSSTVIVCSSWRGPAKSLDRRHFLDRRLWPSLVNARPSDTQIIFEVLPLAILRDKTSLARSLLRCITWAALQHYQRSLRRISVVLSVRPDPIIRYRWRSCPPSPQHIWPSWVPLWTPYTCYGRKLSWTHGSRCHQWNGWTQVSYIPYLWPQSSLWSTTRTPWCLTMTTWTACRQSLRRWLSVFLLGSGRICLQGSICYLSCDFSNEKIIAGSGLSGSS